MVFHCISLVVEAEAVIHEVLGHVVGHRLGVFYADDGLLLSQHPKWIQVALNILIGLFQKIGLATNVAKLKKMTCQPGSIRSGIL